MPVRIIHDSEHIRIMVRQGSSPYALVTFNPATMTAGNDEPWCGTVADEADLTMIAFMTHRTWYPAEEMKKAAETIRPLLAGYRQVIGYGAATGGYGVLKHSRLLGLTHVLSFAPLCPVAPEDLDDPDPRIVRNDPDDPQAAARIRADDVVPRPIIVYDPCRQPDRLAVERIAEACPRARLVKAYLTGSDTAELFRGTDRTLGLLNACLETDTGVINRLVTMVRRDPASDLRARALAELYIESDIDAACRLMDRRSYVFPRPVRGSIAHRLAGRLMAAGRLDEAAAWSAASITDLPTVDAFYVRRAAIAERQHDYGTAISVCRLASERWPGDLPARLRLAAVLRAAGNLAAADDVLDGAAAIDPADASVILASADQAKLNGDTAAELTWTRRLVEAAPTGSSLARLAGLLAETHDHAGASAALEQAVAVDADDARHWKRLAESRMQERRHLDAADALLQAVRRDPDVLGPQRAAIVYESEHLRIIYHAGSSDFALITFNPATWLASDMNFWCRPIVEKAAITAVGIMTHRANWYPADDMKQAIAVINRLLAGFEEVVAYGSAMGGYGVLKYGRALHATRVLAFAPQWSIAPKDVGEWDKRFVSDYRPDLNGDMSVHADDMIDDTFIFYDPFFRDDRSNIEKLVEINPACHLITAHLTGHSVVAIFAGTARAMRLFDLCRARDLQGLRRQATVNRRDPDKHYRVRALADIYLKSDPVAAKRILDRRPDAFGAAERGSFNYQLAAHHVGLDDLDKAASFCAAAVAEEPDVAEFRLRLSMIEERRGNHPAALSLARSVIDRVPKHKGASLRLFEALISSGDLAAAERQLETASSLDPGSPPVITARLKLAMEKGDQKSGAHWMERLIEVSPTASSYQRYAGFMTGIGRHDAASAILRRLVEIGPANASYWQMLATSYLREPRNIQAAEAAEQAARLAPDDPRSYELAAIGYRRAGLSEYATRNEVALERRLAAVATPKVPDRPDAIVPSKPGQGWRNGFSLLARRKPGRSPD